MGCQEVLIELEGLTTNYRFIKNLKGKTMEQMQMYYDMLYPDYLVTITKVEDGANILTSEKQCDTSL